MLFTCFLIGITPVNLLKYFFLNLLLIFFLQPKYIQALIEKAKQREREHEIVYEKKIAKERSKDDHLYADKDKFVTSAYKKKLAEQAKWMEEERLRELREERDDVCLTTFFYFPRLHYTFGSKFSIDLFVF